MPFSTAFDSHQAVKQPRGGRIKKKKTKPDLWVVFDDALSFTHYCKVAKSCTINLFISRVFVVKWLCIK
jgi:hypothetical protein